MYKKLGTYGLGTANVSVFVNDGRNGAFSSAPTPKALPSIMVGLKDENWNEILSVLLHEAFEGIMAIQGSRYARTNDFGNDVSDYQFFFHHSDLSDYCGRVGGFVAAVLPDLNKAWREHQKKKGNK